MNTLRAGLDAIRRRPRLAALIYVVDLVAALLIALPIYVAVQSATSGTGVGERLAGEFDLMLWINIFEESGSGVLSSVWLLLWTLPLAIAWKVAAGIGLTHALRDGASRRFLTGVRRYFSKALVLALLLAAFGVIWTVIVAIGMAGVQAGIGGAAATYWINLVALPVALFLGLALLQFIHDQGRIALVRGAGGVLRSLKGMRWAFRSGSAWLAYGAWGVLALLLGALPFLFDASATADTGLGVWSLFLAQQLLWFLLALCTVGRIGSEVAVAEARDEDRWPLIAEEKAGGDGARIAAEEDGPRTTVA